MSYAYNKQVEPGFEINEQFTVADLHYVFGIDAFETSRPIDFQVNTPDEINQMFDAISYEKGKASILPTNYRIYIVNIVIFPTPCLFCALRYDR